jgi:hypothetical protein
MTSRRSMLKWLPAAWLGGWWGLGQKAGALPAAAELPAAPAPADPAAGNVARGVAVTRTYYDRQGRVIAVYREYSDPRPITTRYQCGLELA